MASPQIVIDRFTKMPKHIVTALIRSRIAGEPRQVFDLIWDESFGYHREWAGIAIQYFAARTTMLGPSVCRAINKAVKMNIIKRIKRDKPKPNLYSINQDTDTWKPLTKKLTDKKANEDLQKGKSGGDEKATHKRKAKDTSKDKYVQSFEKFYKEYPKKQARRDAEKAWIALKPKPELVSTIMSALAMHKVSESWLKENGKFIPLPATWIRGRRWEDSVISKYAMEDLPQLKARLIKARENKKWWEGQIKDFGESADLSAKLSAAEAEIAMLRPEIERLGGVK